MKTTSLGTSGVQVSVACLGAMRFGTATPEPTSFEILDAYVDSGGSFVDTANVYAAWEPGGKGGESEELLGRWFRLRKNRGSIFLATKLGSRFQSTGAGLRAEQVRKECEGSLKRLGVETIDLYYAHFDDRQTPVEETMEAFNGLISAGKVRFIGASNFRAWRLEEVRTVCRAKGWQDYCCVQQRYSYYQPVVRAKFGAQVAANEDLIEYCSHRGLPILAYSPLLKGCYERADRPCPSAYTCPQNEARLAVLKEIARARNATPNQIVLAWMSQDTPRVIPIIGASNVAQLRQNLQALDIPLSREEMDRMNSAGTTGT